MLSVSLLLPSLFGWIPSDLKFSEWFQKRLRFSIKPTLSVLHADWSQTLRLRILEKRPTPRNSVGTGPEIKNDFPHARKSLGRLLKSILVSSDCWQDVSFEPTWTITRSIEDGRERSRPGISSSMTWTVAPGKPCVVALKKRTFLIMESPTNSVVGGKRGQGKSDCGFT